MMLKQYYLGCLAHASYLIAGRETATAVVVDPQRDVEQYLADAAQQEASMITRLARAFASPSQKLLVVAATSALQYCLKNRGKKPAMTVVAKAEFAQSYMAQARALPRSR